MTISAEYLVRFLNGGLWRSTSQPRFTQILNDGMIFVEPNMRNEDRWKTSRGPDYYPYVRHLGGISLFDFSSFDIEKYQKKCPLSSWREFVPFRKTWGHTVWIEIDRVVAAECLILGEELLSKWKTTNSYQHTIMPYIEVAHIGDISITHCKRAILVDSLSDSISTLNFN